MGCLSIIFMLLATVGGVVSLITGNDRIGAFSGALFVAWFAGYLISEFRREHTINGENGSTISVSWAGITTVFSILFILVGYWGFLTSSKSVFTPEARIVLIPFWTIGELSICYRLVQGFLEHRRRKKRFKAFKAVR